MEPEESERMSVLLSLILEKDIGSQKEVEIRRKTLLFKEKLDNARNENHSIFNTGSSAEGFSMRGSDNDAMIVDKAILLVNSGQQVPSDSNHDMVLLMREAENCQRGYVELELQLEFDELPAHGYIRIPPLPYAIFLAFLSYHEIGDIGRRDDCLRHLIAVKYDEDQGGHRHWIVHTLLGICYQTVGDSRRAIKAYEESLTVDIQWNPALDRIELLER
ncbi:uncharacterized protein LOC110465754 isoform X2 [Mizuhopecten yessoensis]|uniref:uncharacterized protein LOC110465754 isoform X2 n=1 Tax=Mizuhopecten yessoensis TaxID=6573 RepID=UPI000B45EA98|nr:uncharacterized protein LOC110465754 isoform X2 [Mizuhopecten yessoensis]